MQVTQNFPILALLLSRKSLASQNQPIQLKVTVRFYDQRDCVLSATNPLSQTETSEYDQEGNLIGFTTRNQVKISYQYNARNEQGLRI